MKLDTNGTHPDVLREILEKGLVDYVAMDVKNSPARYALTAGLTEKETDENSEPAFVSAVRMSIRILMESGVDYEFRTTVVEELHREEDFEEIGTLIKGAKRYFLQCFTDRDTVPYAGLSAPSKAKLEACAAIVRQYVGDVKIRGVE